jgi:hypothetical protein
LLGIEILPRTVPPVGRSGGILLGVDTDLHEVVETETGKHFIRMWLSDKISGLSLHLVVVYGPTQLEDKDDFIAEFAHVCNKRKKLLLLVVISISSGKQVRRTNPVYYQDGFMSLIPSLN